MKALFASLSLGVTLAVLVALPGCQVQVDEGEGALPFSCAVNEDCGDEGLICAQGVAGAASFCCKPVTESCNGKDDNCNGTVDDIAGTSCYTGPVATRGKGICKDGLTVCGDNGAERCTGDVKPAETELCNGLDDNCNGDVDEGFDFQTSSLHCGGCNKPCETGFACMSGACMRRNEMECWDGVDNDADGPRDCFDTDCRDMPCGSMVGAACQGSGFCGETSCSDGQDNDRDNKADCTDTDCNTKSCGTGCVCASLAKKETACNDTQDNDGDNAVDCADGDCVNELCGIGCVCSNQAKKETACTDNQDNDGDNGADCADTDCANVSCGTGCVCTNLVKKETVCNDTLDNDGEGGADCADAVDCPTNTVCGRSGGKDLRCQADRTCK